MAVVCTATAGLCIWIVLWALNVSGFDGIMIAAAMVAVVIAILQVAPLFSGRKE
jgi:hypothetical protein